MSRDQQQQIAKQGMANSAEDQGNARTSLAGAKAGLDAFNSRLGDYYASDPYKTGGEFEKDQSTINAGRANVNAKALDNELTMTGKRSGENTSSYAPNLVATQRQGVLDEADAQAKSDATRLDSETRFKQFGVNASEFPVTANDQQYASSLGAGNSSLSTANDAAKAPGFWDWFVQNAQQGAATGAKIAGAGGA